MLYTHNSRLLYIFSILLQVFKKNPLPFIKINFMLEIDTYAKHTVFNSRLGGIPHNHKNTLDLP